MKRGRLIRRYKRFLVDLERPDGSLITAYCPATGRLSTCYKPGAPVQYSWESNPERSLDYDWWSLRRPDSWVVIDPRPAEPLALEGARQGYLDSGFETSGWEPQAQTEEFGRLDFRNQRSDRPDHWIEVKAVTWRMGSAGLFPDAPSERATRQVRALADHAREGGESSVIFVSMRQDIDYLRPACGRDPDFTEALTDAYADGVRLYGLACEVGPDQIQPGGRLPVELPAPTSRWSSWSWRTISNPEDVVNQ